MYRKRWVALAAVGTVPLVARARCRHDEGVLAVSKAAEESGGKRLVGDLTSPGPWPRGPRCCGARGALELGWLYPGGAPGTTRP